jgi:hypothetical protein
MTTTPLLKIDSATDIAAHNLTRTPASARSPHEALIHRSAALAAASETRPALIRYRLV